MSAISELKITDLEKAPIYCGRCGIKMTSKKQFSHYNKQTGEPAFDTKVYCPSFLGYFGHPSYDYDEDGDEIYTYF